MSVYETLNALGISLLQPGTPAGAYTPMVRVAEVAS